MQLVKIKKIKEAVSLAVLALKEGKVLILPTDTVYGFVALDKKAVKRIYDMRNLCLFLFQIQRWLKNMRILTKTNSNF